MQAVYFLLHFPSPHGARLLAGILLCGARTFLHAQTHSDCLASFDIMITPQVIIPMAQGSPRAPSHGPHPEPILAAYASRAALTLALQAAQLRSRPSHRFTGTQRD